MTVLDDIVAGVRVDLAAREQETPLSVLEAAVDAIEPAHDPMPAFRAPDVALIAEVKRRSPSRGALASIEDPAALARQYAEGGAAAISVLTEPHRFGGSLDDLRAVRDSLAIPVLRKDFIVTPYQLWETRAARADLVLLIVAALDQPTLDRLHRQAHELGLQALVEVHDEEELARALDVGAELVGVNARDLKTLEVDRDAFVRLAPRIPDGVVVVAESGVRHPQDVERYAEAGAHVVLVGEALVIGTDPTAAAAAMVEAGRRTP